jgi:regulator of protease activity HflC (stomatin/prohibitin superfamily)
VPRITKPSTQLRTNRIIKRPFPLGVFQQPARVKPKRLKKKTKESVMPVFVIVILVGGFLLLSGFRVAQQYERALVFRFGRFIDIRGPGLFWIIPMGIETSIKVDMRVLTDGVEQQEAMTRDNVPVQVNAVIWYRVVKPDLAVIEVQNVRNAVIQVALTTLRNVIGQHSLDDVLKEREKLSGILKERVDSMTEAWGVEIQNVEMKNVEIPATMQRAMAQEAEALREKRARIIKAEAEFEAAMKLREAADEIMKTPASLELRRMQMLTEVGAEQNTMTIVMMPSEFVEAARAIAQRK